MITQKLYRNGNSVAVTIPKEYLKNLELNEDSEVTLEEDTDNQIIFISPKRKQKNKSSISPEFFKWLEDFNKQYGPALRELAKK